MTKHLTIDLRWIDASGVGTYIKGILPGLISHLTDVSITGIGDAARIREFNWSQAPNFRTMDCRADRYSIAEQVQLPRAIPRTTDLFFSPYYTTPLLYTGKLAVTVHDLSHLLSEEITSDFRKKIYAKTMFRALVKRASIIFTVSQFTKSELLRYTNVRASKVLPIHLGVASEWRHARNVGALRSQPYLIYVGNIKPNKNLGRLVEGFLRVRDRIPQDLVIVGQKDGFLTGESSKLFDRIYEASDRIHLMGQVPYKDLLALVGHADALIMPSLYEGFGLPPIEAMAAGVPALVSTAASLPEVCGDAALYFDPLHEDQIGNAILRIASDQSLRLSLREAGLRRSQQFTWDTCAEKTAHALLGCL
ncbi:MAG TPA: glycosyltransferase family 1 protein [Edaphobacter sp.]|nr:glycosyltransferase family 1 protein [Edaphobacter sp.]